MSDEHPARVPRLYTHEIHSQSRFFYYADSGCPPCILPLSLPIGTRFPSPPTALASDHLMNLCLELNFVDRADWNLRLMPLQTACAHLKRTATSELGMPWPRPTGSPSTILSRQSPSLPTSEVSAPSFVLGSLNELCPVPDPTSQMVDPMTHQRQQAITLGS
jgi:hypothetical protein